MRRQMNKVSDLGIGALSLLVSGLRRVLEYANQFLNAFRQYLDIEEYTVNEHTPPIPTLSQVVILEDVAESPEVASRAETPEDPADPDNGDYIFVASGETNDIRNYDDSSAM